MTTAPRRGGQQIIPRPTDWQPSPSSPWPIDPVGPVGLQHLCESVAARGPGVAPPWLPLTTGSSAVLVVLFEGENGAEVVLTRRAWHLRTHKGEVCFPGGRQDIGETTVATALREANEEVDLDPTSVTIVGELHHMATVASSSIIVPVVGRLRQPPSLRLATPEVDRVFTVPLVDLMLPGVFHEEHWTREGRALIVPFFELADETIWGATARILRDLLLFAAAQES